MAKPGPRKKAGHLKVLKGTDRPGREVVEVEERAISDEPPEHLPDLAKEFWRRTVPQLRVRGLGTESNAPHLEEASMLYHRARVADEVIQREGATFICSRTENPKRHPMAVESLQCWKELRLALSEIGLTDAKAKPKAASSNPFEEIG